MSIEQKQYFHGELYTQNRWSSKHYICCRLCKTQNKEGKNAHWAKGLCRSCYRRLSLAHRLYNDEWNKKQKENRKQRSRQAVGRKDYKSTNPDQFIVLDKDIDTLLDRYDWRCAYSATPLQGFDYKRGDAFQVEYRIKEDNKIELVPICRAINCSKKSLKTEEELEKWANKIGIAYPFYFISVEEYLSSLKD